MIVFRIVASPANCFEIVRVVAPAFALGCDMVGVQFDITVGTPTITALLTRIIVTLVDECTNLVPVVGIVVVPAHHPSVEKPVC
jgi:hypothetical protein